MNIRRATALHLALAPPHRRPLPGIQKSAKTSALTHSKLPVTTYIICTNPRSGSWLLSEGLASTGVAGNPREWFNIGEEQQHRALWRMEHASDLDYRTYLEIARAASTTGNGVSGIKLHYYQILESADKIGSIVTSNGHGMAATTWLPSIFPGASYIWLTRRDKARQAISMAVAASTREWWSIEGLTANPAPEKARTPEFDPYLIAATELELRERDSQWQSYYRSQHITPFVIHYEDLVADYQGTVQNVLKWLKIPGVDRITVPPPRLRRQSNAQSEEWLERYIAFKKENGDLASTPAADKPERVQKKSALDTLDTIPEPWKGWIGQRKVLNASDESIVEVLVHNGYGHALASAEVRKAAADPYLSGAARVRRRLQKGASLLNVMGQLARLDAAVKTIDRCTKLSRVEFRDRYYAKNRPVILTGLMTNWRAMTAWTPDYLKRVAGDQTVEVMAGREADPKYEMNARAHRKKMRFAEYVDLVYSGKITNDYYLVANNAFFQKPEMRPLLKDFIAFPEYLSQTTENRQCFLWFGPAGTVTPLHHDTSNILLAQVAGRKRYRLIPSSQWQYVYNSDGVFSEVDCENPNFDRCPGFRNASVIDIVMKPGEVLFVPVGWWHQVRALDVSITVTFTNFVFPNHFNWEQ